MDLKSASLFAAIVIWPVAGYPLLAALTSSLGGNNTALSIAGRGLVALAALLLLSRWRPRATWVLVLFGAFWLAYALRLVISLHIRGEPVSRTAETFWIWSLGACLLPALAVHVGFSPTTALRLPRPLLVISLISIGLLLLSGGTAFLREDGTMAQIDRWNVGALNPISMGHLGVTAILLGLSIRVTRGHDRRMRMLALVSIGAGAVIAVLANSRGPFVALALAFSVLLIARARHRRALWMAIATAMGALWLALSAPDLLFGPTGVLARFTAISEGTDMSAEGRTIAFAGALRQFLSAPLFGDALEERITGYYPHNVTLEAFMATGLIGGLPFLLLTLGTLRAAWGLARMGSTFTWIGLLAVQYLVAAQFSGAIYQSPAMWVMALLCLAAHRDQLRRRRLARMMRRRLTHSGLRAPRRRPPAPAAPPPQGASHA
ncbi:O-antigen ligase family protein [Marinibacterium profundimaris]|uniref:O-antigen ligase-related domain-containing protein n=1 Tax=Marinibacterium profundimaris TaxID=1679460 RepID=A0A225NVP6_9RHOB|nr:O-antigen ligase family protein [Marinibacterium profundimaris]OWU77378.1 hypothetical protein ATO3_01285 [Marinibacterium profundimaris]